LFFNLLNVALALLAFPLVVRIVEASAPGNLVRQTANLQMFLMLGGTLLYLPFIKLFTRLVLLATPSKQPTPEPSFLDDKLLAKPEQALAAVIQELRRMAEVCVDSMMLNGELILHPTRQLFRRLLSNEKVINEVRLSMGEYLNRLTQRYLSRRQTLFLQHLDRCMKDIERIGDHIAHIGKTSVERFKDANAMVPEDLFHTWFTLFCTAKRVIGLMARSFNSDSNAFQNTALQILHARDAYIIQSMDAKAKFAAAARDKRIAPIGGYHFSRYIEDLDRLVRRAKSIAFAERQPDFWVKTAKLTRQAKAAPAYTPPSLVDPKEYLELLQRESPFDNDDLPEDSPVNLPAQSPHQTPPDEVPIS
jgi:Na+/phosphate symporter